MNGNLTLIFYHIAKLLFSNIVSKFLACNIILSKRYILLTKSSTSDHLRFYSVDFCSALFVL